jgi:hypothetical protein
MTHARALPERSFDSAAYTDLALNHRPKSRRCFVFDPRLHTPEQNFPRPMMPRLFRREYLAAKTRSPSRTTSEGVQPSSRTSAASLFRDRSSSLV